MSSTGHPSGGAAWPALKRRYSSFSTASSVQRAPKATDQALAVLMSTAQDTVAVMLGRQTLETFQHAGVIPGDQDAALRPPATAGGT